MKVKLTLALAITAVLILFLSSLTFTADEEKAPVKQLETEAERLSYTLGLEIGASLKDMPAEINLAVFARGVEDSLKGNEPLLSPEQCSAIKEEFTQKIRAERIRKMEELSENNRKESEVFLAENEKKEGIITTESGLQYLVLNEGDGPQPKATDRVSVHYRGTLIDGTEFDSSYARGEPTAFPVGGVIRGWTEALQLMKVGSRYRLFIPSDLAYGVRGAPPKIGPNATLIFEVELLEIEVTEE